MVLAQTARSSTYGEVSQLHSDQLAPTAQIVTIFLTSLHLSKVIKLVLFIIVLFVQPKWLLHLQIL